MKRIFVGVIGLIFSVTALAQSDTRVSTDAPTSEVSCVAAQGFRFTLMKSFLKIKGKFSYGGRSFTDKETVDQSIGLGLGYVYLPVASLGFTGRLLYNIAEIDADEGKDPDYSTVRLEANGAYSFNSNLYGFAGLNLNKYTETENGMKEFNIGPGFQLGIGVQLSRNFGFDLQFVQLNNKAEKDGATADFEQSGIELGAHGTF